jgi:hypothetical protein
MGSDGRAAPAPAAVALESRARHVMGDQQGPGDGRSGPDVERVEQEVKHGELDDHGGSTEYWEEADEDDTSGPSDNSGPGGGDDSGSGSDDSGSGSSGSGSDGSGSGSSGSGSDGSGSGSSGSGGDEGPG